MSKSNFNHNPLVDNVIYSYEDLLLKKQRKCDFNIDMSPLQVDFETKECKQIIDKDEIAN